MICAWILNEWSFEQTFHAREQHAECREWKDRKSSSQIINCSVLVCCLFFSFFSFNFFLGGRGETIYTIIEKSQYLCKSRFQLLWNYSHWYFYSKPDLKYGIRTTNCFSEEVNGFLSPTPEQAGYSNSFHSGYIKDALLFLETIRLLFSNKIDIWLRFLACYQASLLHQINSLDVKGYILSPERAGSLNVQCQGSLQVSSSNNLWTASTRRANTCITHFPGFSRYFRHNLR